MASVQLIVCEKSPRWAAALRAALRGAAPQVVESRSLTSCIAALAEAPASLVVVDIQERKLEVALNWLDQVARQFPLARVVISLSSDFAPAEMLVREAGAIDVLYTTQQATSLVRLAKRQFALSPERELDLHEWLAERMPWPAYAGAPV